VTNLIEFFKHWGVSVISQIPFVEDEVLNKLTCKESATRVWILFRKLLYSILLSKQVNKVF
jgi:hypothetical protein